MRESEFSRSYTIVRGSSPKLERIPESYKQIGHPFSRQLSYPATPIDGSPVTFEEVGGSLWDIVHLEDNNYA